jgi:hypothetical protein
METYRNKRVNELRPDIPKYNIYVNMFMDFHVLQYFLRKYKPNTMKHFVT